MIRRTIGPLMAALTIGPVVLSGCTSTMRGLQPEEAPIAKQAIFVHRDGRAVEPVVGETSRKFTSDTAYGVYLGGIMDAIRADTTRREGKHKILLRIHGGLNALNSSLEASLAMRDSMRRDVSSGYFPVFVNWESGLTSSLGEHLFNSRRGEYYPGFSLAGLPLFPIYLASDLGQGLARVPITGIQQLRHYFAGTLRNTQAAAPERGQGVVIASDTAIQTKAVDIVEKRERILAQTQILPTANRPHDDSLQKEPKFQRFEYKRSWTEAAIHVGAATAYSIPPNVYVYAYRRFAQNRQGWSFSPGWAGVLGWIPLKPAVLYLVDALGTPAWDMMHRRSQGMFQDPNAFGHQQNAKPGYVPPKGALTSLLDSLEGLIRTDTRTKYELTIVGHSMGAIVATEIARRRDSLPIDNIVFMAAAASMREFEVGVIPYMQRHPHTQFYNLSLHPFADLRESHFLRVPPYGSLLEWVDGYFSHPENDFDRMMGKYNNVMQASFMFPTSIRPRIHIKGFGYRDGSGCGPGKDLPFQHGDFNALSVPFWRPRFWEPAEMGCEEIKKQPAAAAR